MNSQEKKDLRGWFFLFAGVLGILLILLCSIFMPKTIYSIIAAILWLPVSVALAYFMAKLKG